MTKTITDCGTSNGAGKKKACKDCTCGLADELATEEADQVTKKAKSTTSAAKSSCGNVCFSHLKEPPPPPKKKFIYLPCSATLVTPSAAHHAHTWARLPSSPAKLSN